MDGLIDNRYQILKQLGAGGFAVVYKAHDTRVGVEVAVKILNVDRLSPEAREVTLKRFYGEVQTSARFTHPNIIKVMDFGEYEGKPYLVMPYLPGGTLKERLGKPLPWKDAFRFLAPIARALEYAHLHGIIHRDVKPANILITDSGQPILADFGIAKIQDREETRGLTATGMGIGTVGYAALEQWRGNATEKSDQYALGVVLYEMITGRKPYDAQTLPEIIIKQLEEEIPHPSRLVQDLPTEVSKLLLKALERDAGKRFSSMGVFAGELERRVEKGRRPMAWEALLQRYWGAALGLIALIALFIFGSNIIFGPKKTAETPPASTALFTEIPLALNTPPSSTNTASATNTPKSTNTPQLTATPKFTVGSTITGIDGMTLLYVPAGQFTMGSNDGFSVEEPVHKVYLDTFWIDQTEVTNSMYKKCVDAGKCFSPSNTTHYSNSSYSSHPIAYVDWKMAIAYCTWAGRRLPTEAEWEKAARGTDGRTYPWGEEFPNAKLLNYVSSVGETTEVGKYPSGASLYGVLDLEGNVQEWVSSLYFDYPYNANDGREDLNSSGYRVIRGGETHYLSHYNVRSALRLSYPYTYTFFNIGFRCARSQ